MHRKRLSQQMTAASHISNKGTKNDPPTEEKNVARQDFRKIWHLSESTDTLKSVDSPQQEVLFLELLQDGRKQSLSPNKVNGLAEEFWSTLSSHGRILGRWKNAASASPSDGPAVLFPWQEPKPAPGGTISSYDRWRSAWKEGGQQATPFPSQASAGVGSTAERSSNWLWMERSDPSWTAVGPSRG